MRASFNSKIGFASHPDLAAKSTRSRRRLLAMSAVVVFVGTIGAAQRVLAGEGGVGDGVVESPAVDEDQAMLPALGDDIVAAGVVPKFPAVLDRAELRERLSGYQACTDRGDVTVYRGGPAIPAFYLDYGDLGVPALLSIVATEPGLTFDDFLLVVRLLSGAETAGSDDVTEFLAAASKTAPAIAEAATTEVVAELGKDASDFREWLVGRLRKEIAETLGALRTASATSVLVELAFDSSAAVRIAAGVALADIDDAFALETATWLCEQDGDAEVQEEVCSAVGL